MDPTRVNLTERNKDYAVFLPSISTFYNNFIAKQRETGNQYCQNVCQQALKLVWKA